MLFCFANFYYYANINVGDIMNTQLDQILSQNKTVAIIGHINPDGDCFGSMSAIHDYVATKFDCQIHCFAECDTIAEEFKQFTKDIVFNPIKLSHYDTCICVDTACLSRLGRYMDIFHNSLHTICIDHHSTNDGFAQINIVNAISSNCENVYNLLKCANFDLTTSTAGKLFAGIVTDTNNLSVDTVTKDTYSTVIDLMSKGINTHKIINFFMGSNSMPQYKLLCLAMNSAKFFNNNTIMVMRITPEQMHEANAVQEDLNPIVGQAFCQRDAMCALLITPRNHKTHVSFRAKTGIDVSSLAQRFGGGGHKAAAAFTTAEVTEEDLQYIIENLSQQINSLPKQDENIF